MRDKSYNSRSFGFVTFSQKEVYKRYGKKMNAVRNELQDAQSAIRGMNGAMVGRRRIRTEWGRNSEGTNGGQSSTSKEEASNAFINSNIIILQRSFESIYNATDANNTTVYLGVKINGIKPSNPFSYSDIGFAERGGDQ